MTSSTTPTDSPRPGVASHIQRYVDSGGADGYLWYGADGKQGDGAPILLLTTIGRTSGQARRTALIFGRDGDDYIIIASQGGAPTHPLWYGNLTANPDVTVQVKADVFGATARTATPAERGRLWDLMSAIWSPYPEYQKKTDREIPVVILTPKAG
jgi:deazaflavin-dependent oxidoreductase (nitroreductase family)